MEQGVYEDRAAIVALFQCGYATSKIHTMLKLLKLNLRFIQQFLLEWCAIHYRSKKCSLVKWVLLHG